eukprot:6197555-Pleurochrysis_carterae.AAC.3
MLYRTQNAGDVTEKYRNADCGAVARRAASDFVVWLTLESSRAIRSRWGLLDYVQHRIAYHHTAQHRARSGPTCRAACNPPIPC